MSAPLDDLGQRRQRNDGSQATIPATAPAYAATRLPGQAPVLTRS